MNRVVLLAVVLLLAGGAAGAAAVEMPTASDCLSGAVVQEVLLQGKARRLAEIRRNLVGDIVRADLCRAGALLVYRVTLLDAAGKVRRVLLDATTGRIVYDSSER